MNKISKVVWVGLLVNIAWFGVVWYGMASVQDVYDELSYSDRKFFDIFSYLKIPFCISIAMQIISLPVLFKLPKVSKALAFIGSLLMLPVSLIFIIGYLISAEKHCNNGLAVYVAGESNMPDNELNFATSKFAMQGILFIVIGTVLVFVGVSTGWLVACAGVVALSNSIRLKKHIMVGLLQDKLIITPGIYSDTCLVPLSDITLIKEDKKVFKLHIRSAGVDRKCTFRKNMIEEENYQPALEDIISKLARQNSSESVKE